MAAQDNGSITLPGWWIKIATASLPILAIIFVAAIPWAWNLQSDVAGIRLGIEFQQKANAQDKMELNRRIDDVNRRLDDHELRLRKEEGKP